jgi:hypothetical protein
MQPILNFLFAKEWIGVQPFISSATFIVITIYTILTAFIARRAKEELGLKKRPIVAIYCRTPNNFNFTTRIRNLSSVHAKARIKAIIKMGDDIVDLANDNPYSGSKEQTWEIQAGLAINGHLDFLKIFSPEKYGTLQSIKASKNVTVTFETTVINYYDSERHFRKYNSRNPRTQWYWDHNKQVWIAEVCPK